MSCTGGYLTGLAIGLPTGVLAGAGIVLAVAAVWLAWRLFR